MARYGYVRISSTDQDCATQAQPDQHRCGEPALHKFSAYRITSFQKIARSQCRDQALGCEPSHEPAVNSGGRVASCTHPARSLFGTLSCVSDLRASPMAYAAA